jgi:hypothetical protein
MDAQQTTELFELGHCVATPGALKAIEDAGDDFNVLLMRHASGDYGDLDDYDKRLNALAIQDGSRILSAYHTSRKEKIYIITEAQDDDGRREYTTILLPSEY